LQETHQNQESMDKRKFLKGILAIVFLACLSYFAFRAFTQDPLRVLITAPEGYSQRFEKSFTGTGIQPIAIPVIETISQGQSDEIRGAFYNIDDIDYIAFSSRKAIQALEEALQKHPEIKNDLRKVELIAIGKDIDYLREVVGGGQHIIVPSEPSPAGIANELAKQENIQGKTIAVWVPRVEEIKEPYVVPDFMDRLEKIGLKVIRNEVYITRPARQSNLNDVVQNIQAGKVQCIAFTSSAEIDVLLKAYQKPLPEELVIACFGPYTTAFAQEKGLHVAITATNFSSFLGFVEAIEAYYDKH